MSPWLAQSEIDDICDPLVQPAAQCKYLHDLGLNVKKKPNGRALVLRSNVEDVLGGLPAKKRKGAAAHSPAQPDAAGLRLAYSR